VIPTSEEIVKLNHGLRIVLIFSAWAVASAQTTPEQLTDILGTRVQPLSVAEYELQQYLEKRLPKLPAPASAAEWSSEAERLRQHILRDVVFHGWPNAWVEGPANFQEAGVIATGAGYRIRKFRYEIVPGFWSVALLYEPEGLEGNVPAILNLSGHFPLGKSLEFKQKQCINLARHRVMALNLEWLGMEELKRPENNHDLAAQLDLVGANAEGLFYLAMRKGLDYLYDHPHVDPKRIGVTGLSGGGWQSIVLSSLDTRIAVSIPVAGFSSLESNIPHPKDTDEVEEDGADFRSGQDYPELVALRAPRPTLLIYSENDDCCFRASLVRPYVFDRIRPFFALYGKEHSLEFHANTDYNGHNYQHDNRTAAYRFISQAFGLPPMEEETWTPAELKTPAELAVGLPVDNLTILALARKFADQITRPKSTADFSTRSVWAESERTRLKDVIRYQPVSVVRDWRMLNTYPYHDVETLSYRLQMSDGLEVPVVWLKSLPIRPTAPGRVVLNDGGKKESSSEVSDALNQGEQVLAVDLLFTGDSDISLPKATAYPYNPSSSSYALILSSTGTRALGIESAQLKAVSDWFRANAGNRTVQIVATGIRSQVVAMLASALDPLAISGLTVHQGMKSLQYILDHPVPFSQAPDLFCLDLYKEFDLDVLATLAEPVRISQEYIQEQQAH
jgi:dienelactone hydrolase